MPAPSAVAVLQPDAGTACLPVSGRIRARLIEAGWRYHANDNIAGFIRGGELAELREEVADRLQEVLHALVIDVVGDHNTRGTAQRVARMFVDEVFGGRYRSAPPTTAFPNVGRLAEPMLVGPIRVRSACSHHLCPIMGRLWIGVQPNPDSALIGLSKYARLAEWVMRRPQIQEEAVVMLADELERCVQPAGLAVAMKAEHFCMHWRGVEQDGASMRNVVVRGSYVHDAELRRVFLDTVSRDGG